MVDFGNEYLVAVSYPFDQRPRVASLGLEVSRLRNMKLESADSDIQRDIHTQPLSQGANLRPGLYNSRSISTIL